MKKYLLLLLLPVQLYAQDPQLEKFVDSLIGPNNKKDVPGTMILIAQDGKPVLKKAYGLASMEMNVPLATDHAFAVGSIGKQFTAVAVLQLAQKGKLQLTDDIRKHLPGYDSYGQVITIEHLITHTSGISSTERKDLYQFVRDNGVSFHSNALISYVTNEKLLFAPGTNWSYNNISFMLAAVIVERLSGQKFGDYLQQHIFQPAGMKNTYLANDLKPRNNVAASYIKNYNGSWRNEDRQNNWGWEKGAGGIISTLDDMLAWDIALRENKVLPKELLEKAWKPFLLKGGRSARYGYGWGIEEMKDYRIVSHGGAVNGYRNNSIHIPEKNLYVYYVNCYGMDQYIVPRKLLSKLLTVPMPGPAKTGNQNLSDYEGAYLMNYIGSRITQQFTNAPVYTTISTSGDTLFMRQTMNEKSFLRPAGKDRFLLPGSENSVYVFNRGENGKVKSFTIESFLFGAGATRVENKKVFQQKKPAEKITTVPVDVLKKYAGTYYNAPGDSYFFVELEGNKMFAHRVNASPKFELLAVSDNKFIRKGMEEYKVSFKEDKDGVLILTASTLRDFDFKKISD